MHFSSGALLALSLPAMFATASPNAGVLPRADSRLHEIATTSCGFIEFFDNVLPACAFPSTGTAENVATLVAKAHLLKVGDTTCQNTANAANSYVFFTFGTVPKGYKILVYKQKNCQGTATEVDVNSSQGACQNMLLFNSFQLSSN